MNAKFEIKTDGDGYASIKMDGVEIAHKVTAITYQHNGDGLPEVNLTFIGDEVSIDSQGRLTFSSESSGAQEKRPAGGKPLKGYRCLIER